MTKAQHIRAVAALCGFVAVLAPAMSYADETITFSTTGVFPRLFGRSGDIHSLAQPFTPTGNATEAAVVAYMGKEGAGSVENVEFAIQADSAGLPSGSDLGIATIAPVASLPTDNTTECLGTEQAFFSATSTGLTLTSGTQYWLIIRKTGADEDTSKTPYLCGKNGTPHQFYYNGSWTEDTRAPHMSISLSSGGGGGGGSASTTPVATSTIDQTQRNVWQAWWVFFAMLVFVVWLGRRDT